MKRRVFLTSLIASVLFLSVLGGSCRNRGNVFTIALYEKLTSLDPVTTPDTKAANDRVRVLIFNSLVKKDEKFDYVPDLASSIEPSTDGTQYTFVLHENVKFHDGRSLTSNDVKYTLTTLLASGSPKSASFFESASDQTKSGSESQQKNIVVPSPSTRNSLIKEIQTPDAKTVIIVLTKPWQALLSNLVSVGIIPDGSIEAQKVSPVGTGPFKFVRFDTAQGVVDLVANEDYWQGAPAIKSIRIRPIDDANTLQAELNSGRVDLAPLPTNLSPDALVALGKQPNLKVDKFPGANIVYLNFNTTSHPLDNAMVRQAIAYAIDRDKIINQLLLGQATIAHSILPEASWAYAPGQRYSYDPAKAKELLNKAGFPDPDGDGPKMRFSEPLIYKIAATNVAALQFASVIQDYLKQVGIPVIIETMETSILIDQQNKGQFQLASGSWIGGNQDPIFLHDLFDSTQIPREGAMGKNRGRYSNPTFDKLVEEAAITTDREKAFGLYSRAQDIISTDLPMLPLWYQAVMVVSKKNVGNIHVDASGDWSFIRNLTIQ